MPDMCEFSCTQNGVTNDMGGRIGKKNKQERRRGGREERRRKKKLKIGNPHLGMVAKEADGIV